VISQGRRKAVHGGSRAASMRRDALGDHTPDPPSRTGSDLTA
jgi:hypothetical protein